MQSGALAEEFLSKFKNLGKRKEGFTRIIEHLSKRLDDSITIIETGTARDRGNWYGDGQSTLIWDWYLSKNTHAKGYSLELLSEHAKIAQSQCEFMQVLVGDSVSLLHELGPAINKCALLYLDSFDLVLHDPHPSSLHHIFELTASWAHLPSGCLIVVDDRISEQIGKHKYVQEFMNLLRIKPDFDGYQIGWVKP